MSKINFPPKKNFKNLLFICKNPTSFYRNCTHHYGRGTMQGKPNYKDIYNLLYVFHGDQAETKNWQCSQRSGSATVTTRKSSGNLVGGELPILQSQQQTFEDLKLGAQKRLLLKIYQCSGGSSFQCAARDKLINA